MSDKVKIAHRNNPEYDSQVDLSCSCGWSTDGHERFSKALKERHIALTKSEVK